MRLVLTIVLLLAGACTTGKASRPAIDPSAEVRSFLDRYVATLEARDEVQVRALFVDDGRFVWFTDGARSYGSADEVIAGMRRFAEVRFQTELADVHVEPLTPDLVSAHSSFRTRLDLPGGGKHEYGGVISWLLERSSQDGSWRVLLGHTSTPGGPPRT
jgi:ketosteroid isomerase-like protein